METIFNNKRRWGPLFITSSLSLFMELAVIRWLSAEIRLIAYYKNLILLAAFLGLSIGFVLVGKGRDFRYRFSSLWGLFAALVVAFSLLNAKRPMVFPGGEDEFLWVTAPVSFWFALVMFMGAMLVFFLISVLLFIPLGQMVGEEMAPHPPVQAYIVNILASLVGVWGFSLISFLRTPPVIWFGIALLGITAYYFYQHKLTRSAVLIFTLSLVIIGIFDHGKLWSPYNRLNLTPLSYQQNNGQSKIAGYLLEVQNTFYQMALNLTNQSIKEVQEGISEEAAQELQEWAFTYDLPYKLVPPQSHVLIVGTGMGNDLAAALRGGMGQVDGVDIDPLILDLGRNYHPEQPYSKPGVKLIEADARSFFNRSREKYDLIVFGLLDSHTLLSGLSSVRLDSYVYTLDSFKQVKNLLKENGYVSISFATNEWIEDRLGRMLAWVFGPDRIYLYRSSLLGSTFIAGDVLPDQSVNTKLASWKPNPVYENLPLATDDWPYLYMRARKIPAGYWQTMLLIALVCLVLFARSFPEALRPEWHFWLLGAAFLLIEFKSITELALLFGTTWFVNSLAISGVLLMALFANLFVLGHPKVNLRWAYVFLFTSMALSYIIPLQAFSGLPDSLKATLSTLLLSLPLLFAGVIFSESLRRVGSTSGPLASNFSGSAVGGLLEYGSILWGIKSLYLVAVLLYVGAFLASLKSKVN